MLVFFGVDACMNPPLAANYTNAAYSGEWYEIGKVIFVHNFNVIKIV